MRVYECMCVCVSVCVYVCMWACVCVGGWVQHPLLWCPEPSITLSSSDVLHNSLFFLLFLLLLRDYTSPHTLRVEFGIAEEMNQFDCSFKVRQMLGPNPAK